MNNKKLTADIALIAMFTALITVCSWISMPFLGVPVSLQTFAVFLATAVLGTKRATASVLSYILLGLTGVPVFSGFNSGISAFLGATGGYLIGFIFAAMITGILIKKLPDKKLWKIISMCAGQIICYIFGMFWYGFIYLKSSETNVTLIFSLCVAPFIIPDIIKITAAAFLSDTVKKAVKKQKIDTN